MVLFEGLKMTAIGAALGLALALPLPKVFAAMFTGIVFAEPRVYFIVPLAIIAVSMLATYLPARRAASVDPTIALRNS
jgi:putative ABC transport system permease protein